MSAAKVLDSYSIIAYLENEPGGVRVSELLKQAEDKGKSLFLSVVNWGEVYYIIARTAGKAAAEKSLLAIETLPIEVIPIDRDMAKMAAELKSTRKMSYADCFAAALARLLKAQVVTGDKEFKEVEDVVEVLWIQ